MKNSDIFNSIISVLNNRAVLAAVILICFCNPAVCATHSSNVDSPPNSPQIITIAYLPLAVPVGVLGETEQSWFAFYRG